MTDKEYVKALLEEINICNKIISKNKKFKNVCKYQIEILNNEYNKAFERLKSQQREIDRLKEENEFLDRTDEERCQEAEANVRASIANSGTSCHWCEETIRKKVAKEILDYFNKYAGTGKLIGNMIAEQYKKYGLEVEE